MKKVLKWIAIVLGVFLVLVIIGASAAYLSARSRINRVYEIQPESVNIPTDSEAIEHGKQMASFMCLGCHGENLGGTAFFDDPTLGYIPASNLTTGSGGVGGEYSDSDWVRAIRHGVGSDGKPLLIMPSKGLYYLSDNDLGAIIAYLKSVPPVDNELGEYSLKPLSHLLAAAGMFGEFMSAESIDHAGPRPAAPEVGINASYGEYLVNISDCKTCHGEDLAGSQSPEPGAPFAPNLSPGGIFSVYKSDADLISFMHTGITPYAYEVDGKSMPWKSYSTMTDEQLSAAYAFLSSLPAVETTTK